MNLLYQRLRSSDMNESRAALAELASMPSPEATRMLEDLAVEPDPPLRARAIWNLVKIAPERAEHWAVKFLADVDPAVRVRAVHSLGRLNVRSAAPLVAELLGNDPDELVRSWAALVLGEIGDTSALPNLRAAVDRDTGADHEGRPIRETAERSIEKILSRSTA